MADNASRWQGHEAFVSWLDAMGYLKNTQPLTLYLSSGLYIYMWEAYLEGAEQGRKV